MGIFPSLYARVFSLKMNLIVFGRSQTLSGVTRSEALKIRNCFIMRYLKVKIMDIFHTWYMNIPRFRGLERSCEVTRGKKNLGFG